MVVVIINTITSNDNDKACGGDEDDYHGDNGVDVADVTVNRKKQLNLCPNFHEDKTWTSTDDEHCFRMDFEQFGTIYWSSETCSPSRNNV